MKKSIILLAITAITLAACQSTPGFVINGTIAGVSSGKMFLIAGFNPTSDTLSQAEIIDGKFTLTGEVDSLTETHLLLADCMKESLTIFLENTTYTVHFDLNDPTRSQAMGTEVQDLYTRYDAIFRNIIEENGKVKKGYTEARRVGDTVNMEKYSKINERLVNDMRTRQDEFIRTHNDSYIAAYALAQRMSGYSETELKEKYRILGANAQATHYGKSIAERLRRLEAVTIGRVAPDFKQHTPEGEPLSLYSLKGKVKILDFWASWCGPCRAENPNVVKLYEEFHSKGLEILSISLDYEKDRWIKAIADDQLPWHHVSDLKGWNNQVAQQYVVGAIPHLMVLDENNVIVAKDLRGDELRAKISEMLK